MTATARYIDKSIGLLDLLAFAGVTGVCVAGIAIIEKYPSTVWVDLIYDDAYYYLGVVRNLVDHGVSSFLPPFETNGYQPLWVCLLSISAFVFGTSTDSMVAQAYGISFLFILFFSVVSKIRYGVLFPAITCVAYFPAVMTWGMETVTIPFFFLLYVGARKWQWRGVFGSILFLGRLDALCLVVAGDVLDVLKRKRVDAKKYLIILPVAAIYMAINLYYFGTPVPVSGLAKAIGNVPGENLQSGKFYFASSQYATLILVLIAIYLAVLRREIRLKYFDEIAISFISLVTCAAYYSLNSGWMVWGWYCWPVFLLTYYLVLEAVAAIKSHAGICRGSPVVWTVVLVAIVFLLAKPALGFSWRQGVALNGLIDNSNAHSSYGKQNLELVAYLRANHVAPGSFFAMGDRAGSFGYFLGNDYRFIHTEGLVGPYDYYRAMRGDKGRDFVDSLKVDYLVVDRERIMEERDVIGVIEPVMPLSSRVGQYLLCFRKSGVVLHQTYRDQKNFPYDRYLIDFRQEVRCPVDLDAQFLALRSQYAGVVKFSSPSHFR